MCCLSLGLFHFGSCEKWNRIWCFAVQYSEWRFATPEMYKILLSNAHWRSRATTQMKLPNRIYRKILSFIASSFVCLRATANEKWNKQQHRTKIASHTTTTTIAWICRDKCAKLLFASDAATSTAKSIVDHFLLGECAVCLGAGAAVCSKLTPIH